MNLVTRHRCALLITVCMLTALATGCSSSSGDPIAGPTTAGGTSGPVEVRIKDYAYNPVDLDLKAGQKITFINDDTVQHSATANDKSFDTGLIDPGKSKTVTIKAGVKGADSYFCTIHDYMKATVTVTT